MKLEGEIWELDLIPQLVELGSQSFTGAIRFENDSVIKIVYFKDGNVLSASTNDRADSIDEILLKSGKVTRDHVKQALSKRKETETLGDALLGLGFIAKRELAWARRVQLIGILRSISEWKSGSFTVVADYLPKREEGTSFPLPQVVLELVLTDQDRPKYERLLESGSVVFRKSASFDGAFPSLGLNQEAASIASRIDGVLSAAEIASESGSDAFNVYKLLNALNLLGLVEKTENLLEVSAAPVAAVPGFGEPASPTVEMALDFGGGGANLGEIDGFGARPAPMEPEPQEFVSDSSVPAEDLMGYETDTPAVDQVEDLGIDYAFPAGASSPPAIPQPSEEGEGLGSLESLRNFEVPPAQFPPIEDRIAQRQQKSKPLSSPPPRGGRKTGMIAAAAIVVLALAAAGGWYFFGRAQQEEPVPVTQAAPPRTETIAPPTAAPSTETTSTVAQTQTSPAAPTASATTTSSAPEPSTPPPAVPKPVAPSTAQQAKPAVVPVTKPPATAPAKAPVPTPAATTPALSSGKYASQAKQYEKEAATVPFTVQFELVCRDASVEKAISVGGSKIWFLPTSYRGEQCYRVFWGRYTNRADAERGINEIPSSLRGGKPSVISPGAGR
ncbi:MAG: DUF4388 domain-containing protein [Thermoanaerobaculia bacterium]|jgi:hypothetical protein